MSQCHDGHDERYIPMTYPQSFSDTDYACITSVVADSPAELAGLKKGMRVLSVGGKPLHDILDWHWFADEDEVELEVLPVPSEGEDAEGLNTECSYADDRSRERLRSEYVVVNRDPGEAWGLEFSEVLFDGLRRCANDCSFCFMKMLPENMRPSLSVRDDDYRLSFLQGNFVTLTNLTDEDVERIIEMQLSPLNVSLHARDPEVRRQMMGKNEARGIEALELLLDAGMECKAQIVLMPGINDGVVLEDTLDWIQKLPGIVATGIVPYGYTRYAGIQQGFDTPESAKAVIRQLHRRDSRDSKVQLADEFYLKAWPGEVLEHLPLNSYYGEYPLLEDGIGMLRQFVDKQERDFRFAAVVLEGENVIATGESFAAVIQELWPEGARQIIAIKNDFFGGNVDVAGLLTAEDIIRQCSHIKAQQLIVPSVMFNDDGLTLDDKTITDIEDMLKITVKMIDFT